MKTTTVGNTPTILSPACKDVAFGDGNAAREWFAALKLAETYAQSLGYRSVAYEGTGIIARAFPPLVRATELQSLILIDSEGIGHVIGDALPEAEHLRLIKSSETLFEEFKKLIDDYHGKRWRMQCPPANTKS
jgi:hypothetical protein